jgi:hypothetical protein
MAQSAQIAKVNPWHQRLADWYIANPTATLAETAAEFKKTVSWICIVKNSDAFQDYFQTLSRAVSEGVVVSVRERTSALADQAIGALQEQLDLANLTGERLPPATLVDIADMALKRTGHGEVKPGTTITNNVIGLVSKDELARHRTLMRSAGRDVALGAEDAPQALLASDTPPVKES